MANTLVQSGGKRTAQTRTAEAAIATTRAVTTPPTHRTSTTTTPTNPKPMKKAPTSSAITVPNTITGKPTVRIPITATSNLDSQLTPTTRAP